MDEEKSQRASEQSGKKKYGSFALTAVIVFFIFVSVVMVVNSRKPGSLTIENVDRKGKGTYFIKANQALIKKMYEKWLPNDLFWPTVLLDNIPSFQIGELEVVRYNVRVLRDNLSRMRTTDSFCYEAAGNAPNGTVGFDGHKLLHEFRIQGLYLEWQLLHSMLLSTGHCPSMNTLQLRVGSGEGHPHLHLLFSRERSVGACEIDTGLSSYT